MVKGLREASSGCQGWGNGARHGPGHPFRHMGKQAHRLELLEGRELEPMLGAGRNAQQFPGVQGEPQLGPLGKSKTKQAFSRDDVAAFVGSVGMKPG